MATEEHWLTSAIREGAFSSLREPALLDINARKLYDEVRQTTNHKVAARARSTMVTVVLFYPVTWRMMRGLLRGTIPPVAREQEDEYLRGGYRRYIGTRYASALVSGVHPSMHSTNTVLAEMAAGPRHRYSRLPAQLRESHNLYRGTGRDFQEILALGGMETVEGLLQVLIGRQRICSHGPTAEELLGSAFAEHDEMLRTTRMPSNVVRKLLPRPPGLSQEDVPFEQWADESTPGDMFAGVERLFVENAHPSVVGQSKYLRQDPNRWPWFCAGAYELDPGLESDRGNEALLEEFLSMYAALAGIKTPLQEYAHVRISTPLFLHVMNVVAEKLWPH